MSADAPIEIIEYDASWPAQFDAERAALSVTLAPWLVAPIEHFGSTAVPALAAKPIIDIMAPVDSLETSRAAIEALVPLGYLHYPYQPDVMHWFCKPSPERRTHHLHLVPFGSELWHQRLRFRDALRRSPALASEYAALKRRLAGVYRDDRDAYTQAKAPFVQRVLSASGGPEAQPV